MGYNVVKDTIQRKKFLMNTAKDYLHKSIDEIGLDEVTEVIDFVEYLKIKKKKFNII